MAPAITDLLEAGRARARDAFAERMPRGLGGRPAPDAGPLADRPWEALLPEVAAALRPELPALADDIVAAVSEGVPDYARPLEGPFGRALRTGVEEALGQFLAAIEDPELARLRDLFGERLDAPDGRFELELALRARRLLAGG